MQGLSTRVGAHGFFCLVRASPHDNTSPKWYYTHEGIEDYLKFVVRRRWDPSLIGTQLEAFAIAGCDINGARSPTWSYPMYPSHPTPRHLQKQDPENQLPDHPNP